jgi:hypothetical protein
MIFLQNFCTFASMNERKYSCWHDWVVNDKSLGELSERTTYNALHIYKWPSDAFYQHFYGIWDFKDVQQPVDQVVKAFHEYVEQIAMPLIEKDFTLVPIRYKFNEFGERRWIDTFGHIPGYSHCRTVKCDLPQCLSFLVYVRIQDVRSDFRIKRTILESLMKVPFYTYNIEVPDNKFLNRGTDRICKQEYDKASHVRKMTGLYDISSIMPVRVCYWLHVTESYLRNDARWFIYGT